MLDEHCAVDTVSIHLKQQSFERLEPVPSRVTMRVYDLHRSTPPRFLAVTPNPD